MGLTESQREAIVIKSMLLSIMAKISMGMCEYADLEVELDWIKGEEERFVVNAVLQYAREETDL